MTKRAPMQGARIVSVSCDAGYSRYEGFFDITNLNSNKAEQDNAKVVVSADPADPTSPGGAPAPAPVPEAGHVMEKCDPHRQYANAKLAQISFSAGERWGEVWLNIEY